MIKDLQFIQDDLEKDNIAFFGFFALITFLIPLIIALYLSTNTTRSEYAYSWAILTCGSGLSLLLLQTKRSTFAAWVYLISFIAFLGLDIHLTQLNSRAFVMLPLPMILSALFMQDARIPVIGMLSIIVATIPTWIHGSWSGLWDFIFIPALVTLVTAGIIWLYAQSKLGFVYWAVDSQRKNEERAKIFYDQREQLKDAMLAVQKANSKLESLNNQLAEARQQAEDASEAKSTFLSNMSHELRTPLNTVIGYSSSMLNMPAMYQHEPLADVYRKDLNVILSNGQYLLGLINDILDLSKIEAGKLNIHPENIDLESTLQGVITTSIGLTQDKPIQIRPEYPENLPKIYADETRVRQILLNLMSNAIKFTESGSVTLAATVVESGVRLAVTDTGVGIPEDALQRIFDRFEQAQFDTDRHYGGTGLGLDISQRLCEMHGSKLEVTSTVGQGSTFAFTMPIAEVALPLATLDDDDTILLLDAPQDDTMFDMPIVLVIENDAPTRKLLRRVLEPNGYIVLEAANGAHGMETMEAALPELIILDLQLPDMDGTEIVAKMRTNPLTADIPVIILSFMEEIEEYSKLANVYFKKPVRPQTLLNSMEKLIKARKTLEPSA